MASVHFVYLLLDPKETGDELFYIGQGQGSRPADHAQESLDWDAGGRPMPAATGTKTPEEIRAKRLRILKILASGRTPRIEFLRTGLSKREVDIVETAAIELIGLDNLCNQVMGPAGKGRMLATAHETLQGSKDLTLDEAAVVVPAKGVRGGSLDYAGLIGGEARAAERCPPTGTPGRCAVREGLLGWVRCRCRHVGDRRGGTR